MEFSYYQKIIRQLSFGKRLPEALYLHTCAIECLPADLISFLDQSLKRLQLAGIKFDLVKFHLREFKVSLLLYPTFWEDPFPELKASYTIDLITMKSRFSSYENSANPPILHRKETFLPPGHPRLEEFAKLTREAEEAGLFENLNRIGFKQNWLRQIKAKVSAIVILN